MVRLNGKSNFECRLIIGSLLSAQHFVAITVLQSVSLLVLLRHRSVFLDLAHDGKGVCVGSSGRAMKPELKIGRFGDACEPHPQGAVGGPSTVIPSAFRSQAQQVRHGPEPQLFNLEGIALHPCITRIYRRTGYPVTALRNEETPSSVVGLRRVIRLPLPL